MKDALALALVHFLWQGVVLAAAGACLMRLSKVPSVRYAIGVATMSGMLLAPAATFVAIQAQGRPAEATRAGAAAGVYEALAATSGDPQAAGSVLNGTNAIAASTTLQGVSSTWILSLWAAGVLCLSLRLVGGWTVARRLATDAITPVSDELQAVAARLAARMRVRTAVRVCESASIAVPMMLGWLRPVIVLPPAALAGLPLAQLEALLAHELAHIRRHDYLVNLLQTGVETLCFYHPGVWWISREVRRHREECCDDVAVGVCDRLTYVTALSALASITVPQLALSAAGGSLRDRVRRLVEPTPSSASPKGAWIAMLPILLVVSFVAPHAWGGQSTPAPTPIEQPLALEEANVVEAPIAVAQTVRTEQERAAREELRARELARAREERERVMADVEERRLRQLGLVREQSERIVAGEVRRILEPRQDAERIVTESARARQALQNRIELLAEQGMEREARARQNVLRQREMSGSTNELVQAEQQMLRAERALDRHRELHERGLVPQSQLSHAEEQVVTARRHLEAARAHRELTETEHQLRSHDLIRERGTAGHRDLVELGADATIQPEDHLTITIAGEPDLPSEFRVREDGSIRFPFLGAIRVQGSTTAQVRTAIQKLISDRGLARNAAVTVSAARGR